MKQQKEYNQETITYIPQKTGRSVDPLFTFMGSVGIPLSIAVIFGVIAIGLLFLAFPKILPRLAGFLGLLLTGIVFTVQALQRKENISEAFLHWAEIFSGTELDDGDRGIVNLEPREVIYRVQSATDGHLQESRYILPYPDTHKELAERTLRGEGFTQANFMRGPRRLYTPDEFDEMKAALLRRNLIYVVDPNRKNSKVLWTDDGFNLLRRIKNEGNVITPPPHPDVSDSRP